MVAKTVLLVDDDKLIGKMIKAFFLSKGIGVEVATSGAEGLEMLKDKKPDAVILDLMMPGMNGFEFCEIVKKDDQIKETPIVILSAFPTEKNIERGFSLGASQFIKKPFNIRELRDKVVAVMK